MRNTLSRLGRKLRHQRGREWGGYLTPTEVLILVDTLKVRTNAWWKPDRQRENKKAGRANPGWFYFFPSADALKRLGIRRGK